MSSEQNWQKLLQEARDLITYSPVLDEDKEKPKSKEVMKKNKQGFEKLKKAVQYDSCTWVVHYNIAEFYYNALDGATTVDEIKAVYHYFKAWKLYGNHTIIREIKSSPFAEPIMVNFAGLVDKIKTKKTKDDDENNDYIIDINEVIQYCKFISYKSQFISYKILSHAIHGRILWFLQKNAKEALIHYKKCIALKTNYRGSLTGHVKMIVEGVEKEITQISTEIPTEIPTNTETRKCEYCKQQKDNLLRCSKCKKVYYCSIDCQRPHWKKHKKICKKTVFLTNESIASL